MSTIPAWAAGYVGIPFVDRGRTRAGADCWGLARLVWAEQFGFCPPSLDGGYQAVSQREVLAAISAQEKAAHWAVVADGDHQAGDCVLMAVLGHPAHVGVVLCEGQMLHCDRTMGAVVESYHSMRWRRTVRGVFRWVGN